MYFPYSAILPHMNLDKEIEVIPVYHIDLEKAERFINEVENLYSFKIKDRATWKVLKTKRRYNCYAFRYFDIRKAVCMVLKENSNITCSRIGQLVMGTYDHSTVVHNVQSAKTLLKVDEEFQQTFSTVYNLFVGKNY
jgi:chromosomal replication initiation ATPase DnaA